MAPGGLLTALICFFVPRLLVADLSSLLHRSLELFVGLLDDFPPASPRVNQLFDSQS